MSTDNNSDEIPVNVISEKQIETNETSVSEESENNSTSEELKSSQLNVDEISKFIRFRKTKSERN